MTEQTRIFEEFHLVHFGAFMEIKPVAQIMPGGLEVPPLNVLLPTVENYTALFIQPLGEIEATNAGVRNRNRALAELQFAAFLRTARDQHIDLVATPEYSLPWDMLEACLRGNRGPEPGKLWILGCESIKYSELESLKDKLSEFATFLYETLEPHQTRFLDPVAYVFKASVVGNAGAPRTVVLIQFKTSPMGDTHHFEINGLQRGHSVYQFGGGGENTIRLLTLICSDAFAFTQAQATAVYDRAIILHLQLNPAPRHDQYRLYREHLLAFNGDATEIICLNWARNVKEWYNGRGKAWKNNSCSVWMLKPDKFDDKDAALIQNHRRGFYYTWLKPRFVHALFFNFEPATFSLNATKVVHLAVNGALSRRRGPQLINRCTWDVESNSWVDQAAADDGFAAIAPESGGANQNLVNLTQANPFATERVLALCAGKIEDSYSWHHVQELDSCVIEASEFIRRLTFCQDSERTVRNFRVKRLRQCSRLWNILADPANLPPALADLNNGFAFSWVPEYPHQNLLAVGGGRATVIYMGEDVNFDEVDKVARKAAVYLQRSIDDMDDNHTARQRLAVWYRDSGGVIQRWDGLGYRNFNKSPNESEIDLAREE